MHKRHTHLFNLSLRARTRCLHVLNCTFNFFFSHHYVSTIGEGEAEAGREHLFWKAKATTSPFASFPPMRRDTFFLFHPGGGGAWFLHTHTDSSLTYSFLSFPFFLFSFLLRWLKAQCFRVHLIFMVVFNAKRKLTMNTPPTPFFSILRQGGAELPPFTERLRCVRFSGGVGKRKQSRSAIVAE